MKFAVLASSSAGNSTYVESNGTAVLIDAGTNAKCIGAALRAIGADPAVLAGICLTHDHTDHTSAVAVLEHRYRTPLYATDGTIDVVCCGCANDEGADWPWVSFAPGSSFEIGALRFEAFPVPHDAGDPVGFAVTDGRARLGFATDLGTVPEVVRHHLRDCDALAIEFNHDPLMLERSDRPRSLVQRIRGRSGHLSNEQGAELLAAVAGPRLRHVLPMHLSGECNRPDLAVAAARDALRGAGLDPDLVREPAYPSPLYEI